MSDAIMTSAVGEYLAGTSADDWVHMQIDGLGGTDRYDAEASPDLAMQAYVQDPSSKRWRQPQIKLATRS